MSRRRCDVRVRFRGDVPAGAALQQLVSLTVQDSPDGGQICVSFEDQGSIVGTVVEPSRVPSSGQVQELTWRVRSIRRKAASLDKEEEGGGGTSHEVEMELRGTFEVAEKDGDNKSNKRRRDDVDGANDNSDDDEDEQTNETFDKVPWKLPKSAFDVLAQSDSDGGLRTTLASSGKLRELLRFIDTSADRGAALEAVLKERPEFENFSEKLLDLLRNHVT